MVRIILPLLLVLGTVGSPTVRGQEAAPEALAQRSLLDVLVEPADLPGDGGFFVLGRNVFPPNTQQTVGARDEVGTVAIYVQDGILTYQIERPGGRIVRAAASPTPREEAAPAGTPFTLAAGDALVYPAGRRVERNEGEWPVTFLWVVILEPMPESFPPPPPDPGDTGDPSSLWLTRYDGPWLPPPDGDVALTLAWTRVTPGALLPAVPGGMRAVAQSSGTIGDLLVDGEGAALNLGAQPVEALMVTLVPAAAAGASPAATQPATSSATGTAAIASEAVVTVSFPAAAMPPRPVVFDAWFSSLGHGDRRVFPANSSPPGIAADVVVDGVLRVESAGRLHRQGSGATEEVTPGTDVTLDAGDAAVYVDHTAAMTVRNPGATELRAVSFGVFAATPPATGDAAVVLNDDWERSGLAGHDVAVTITRLTLPPGATRSVVPRVSAPQIFAVETGTVEWVLTHPDGQTQVLRFASGQVIPFRPLGPDLRLELRNPGAAPLVLLELAPGPAAAATAARAPSCWQAPPLGLPASAPDRIGLGWPRPRILAADLPVPLGFSWQCSG